MLWRDAHDEPGADGSQVGLLHLDAGCSTVPHVHQQSALHVWGISGECSIGGSTLTAGSYGFVPAGVEHAIDVPEYARQGCTLLYLDTI